MSPTAFKDQYTTFLSTLNNAYDLCQIIRATRRFGSAPTPNFDAFQSYTLTTKQTLAYTFTSHRSACGSRFDVGDTIARTELDHAVRSLLAIQSKLSAIAYGHERSGGFQALLYQLQTLEADVLAAFSGLKYRLEITRDEPKLKPKSILKKTGRSDEVVIGIAKLDAYTSHMKNSWVETEVDGEVFYVNVFDGKRKQWERPKDAFVMLLPRNEQPKPALKRRSTWEKDLERERVRQEERERERERQKERDRERERERERLERRRRSDYGW